MNSSQSSEYRRRLLRVLDYINDNLAEELCLELLAQIAGFSPYHFHRIFTSSIGESPRDYIERLRLERSANFLLQHSEKTVTEIALECGFSSHAAFARAFKRKYSVSATEFLRHPVTFAQHPGVWEFYHENSQDLQVIIRKLPAYHLAFTRCMSGYDRICSAWQKLMKFACSRNLVSDTTRYVGISHDNPVITAKDRCRYYACISVPDDVAAAGEVGIMDLPAATYAVYHFKGSAAEIPGVYHSLYRDWFPDSGYIPDDKPPIELYPPDMITHSPEDGFCYDIAIPVKALR